MREYFQRHFKYCFIAVLLDDLSAHLNFPCQVTICSTLQLRPGHTPIWSRGTLWSYCWDYVLSYNLMGYTRHISILSLLFCRRCGSPDDILRTDTVCRTLFIVYDRCWQHDDSSWGVRWCWSRSISFLFIKRFTTARFTGSVNDMLRCIFILGRPYAGHLIFIWQQAARCFCWYMLPTDVAFSRQR